MPFNKVLSRRSGNPDVAIMLGILAEKSDLFSEEDGWFQCPAGEVEKSIGLTRHRQKQAVKWLEEKGIIESGRRGEKGRVSYRFIDGHDDALLEILRAGKPKPKLPKRGKLPHEEQIGRAQATILSKIAEFQYISTVAQSEFLRFLNFRWKVKKKPIRQEAAMRKQLTYLTEVRENCKIVVDMTIEGSGEGWLSLKYAAEKLHRTAPKMQRPENRPPEIVF